MRRKQKKKIVKVIITYHFWHLVEIVIVLWFHSDPDWERVRRFAQLPVMMTLQLKCRNAVHRAYLLVLVQQIFGFFSPDNWALTFCSVPIIEPDFRKCSHHLWSLCVPFPLAFAMKWNFNTEYFWRLVMISPDARILIITYVCGFIDRKNARPFH